MIPVSLIPAHTEPGLASSNVAGIRDTPGKISAAELESLTATGLAPARAPSPAFGSILQQMVEEVSAKSATSSAAVEGLLSGQNVSLHQAMIAMEEASVAFQLMVEVRNKLMESYQELMRMQV